MPHAMKAQQGHRYKYGDIEVLSMQTGIVVRVAEIDESKPWLGQEHIVKASWLTPMPMRYFHGQTPD